MSKKKLFCFDIDGTLAVGDELLTGTRELLEYIDSIGGKSYFITNNSTRSGEDYVKRFREVFGLETQTEQFVTSGMVTIKYMKENYAGKNVLCVGTKSFVEELGKKSGIKVVDTIRSCEGELSAVLVGYDSELTYEKLVNASEALLTTNAKFYGTNPDLRCPAPFGFIPDCGAICDMLTATTDKKPVYLGKPEKIMVEICQEYSGFSAEETMVVGDRLYTDIACGINAGVDTALLLTGEATREDAANTEYKPSMIFENPMALLDYLKSDK